MIHDSTGAVFPLYIWVITTVLAVALIFFVFAQAAVVRSAGQSAADAAALAAAQEARDRLLEGGGDWGDILAGDGFAVGSACAEAGRLAARNDASVVSCEADRARVGYTVVVATGRTVGESLIPGTENQTAEARATAVIRGLCDVATDEDDLVELRCEEDQRWSFDPEDEETWPDARDLFRVYLDE
ncbi:MULTISPECIES: pilus assembly protein TadG-related protein [unclassified Streptomyces]|uniref:pilus assembly protein TadG-related protein n=1 Tax=unclassified Streptomyces TaxID=2593676 RepID=UPI001F224520|nr:MULTISPECIES: pilus assembly protein TadG-related protein [unclassified Streptomyces]MCU4746955.1 pilus assembly protein TadG-related protein [Streptomyces sp. G-5]